MRIAAILGLFIVGGAAVSWWPILFWLASFRTFDTLLGISKFQFVQWIAPLVSEAPEGISAFYWARDHERASIALMNLVSSNINQWTLLAALLLLMVLSVSVGRVAAIPLDAVQSRDLLLTLAQKSPLGAMFLVNMELALVGSAGAVWAVSGATGRQPLDMCGCISPGFISRGAVWKYCG